MRSPRERARHTNKSRRRRRTPHFALEPSSRLVEQPRLRPHVPCSPRAPGFASSYRKTLSHLQPLAASQAGGPKSPKPKMAGERDKKCSDLDGRAPEATDFANYFCTYAFLYHQVCLPRGQPTPTLCSSSSSSHIPRVSASSTPFRTHGSHHLTADNLSNRPPPPWQKDMLEDHKRTGAYYQAVMSNRRQFAGKVRPAQPTASKLGTAPAPPPTSPQTLTRRVSLLPSP